MSPDTLILYNGIVRTLDSARPIASAIRIEDGRVSGVGDDDLASSSVGGTVRRVDLGGRAVYPGFTDAHVHWNGTAQYMHAVKLDGATSKAEALARVAERAAVTPPGQWITGYGWQQADWQDDPRFPTAADLDTVAPNHPVMLKARSGHASWVNSLALRLCQLDAATPDPEGGEILREASGQPSGVLLEWTAMDLVTLHVPADDNEARIAKMRGAQAAAHALGLTAIHDFDWRDSFVALQTMRANGELRLRFLKQINLEYLDSLLDLGVMSGFGDDWLRIGNLKLFIDGALGPRTASMLAPYNGEPDNLGIIVVPKDVAYDAISRASANGVASTVHAIGDRAVRDILDVFAQVRAEEAARGIPRAARRHRIEHVQLIHPDDVGRLAELDLIASMQPIHATSDMPFADAYWGERCAFGYNPRLQLDRGVCVIFGSDSPVDNLSPLAGIHAAVTRRRADGSPGEAGWYPQARVTLDEAVRAYTQGPAYAAGLDGRAGKIAPGYFADFTVLDRDLYAVPPDDLLSVSVAGTMVDGEWVYRQF